jgi:hypothetical protein
MVLVVLRIGNMGVLDFCVVYEFMVVFMVFNLWVGPGLILSLAVKF